MKPVNGFTRKLHPNQFLTYLGLYSLIIIYFLIIFPLSDNLCKIIGVIPELILALTVMISVYMATKTDPTDSIVKATMKAQHENQPYIPPIQQYYCASDSSYTTESSKHCYICKRCTEGYDHHCSWLNNDIGKANYKAFFVLISSLFFFLVIYMVLAIKLTINYSEDSTLLQNDIWKYNVNYIMPVMILVWISIPVSLGIFLFVASLVFLHLFLIKKGITTFQYMVLVEQKKGYEREMQLAKNALGEKERTFFDFVLFLGRNIQKKIKEFSTARNIANNIECQNLNDSGYSVKPERCHDNEQFDRLVVQQ